MTEPPGSPPPIGPSGEGGSAGTPDGDPGRVFGYETGLDHIADACKAMDERRAVKSLVRIGAI